MWKRRWTTRAWSSPHRCHNIPDANLCMPSLVCEQHVNDTPWIWCDGKRVHSENWMKNQYFSSRLTHNTYTIYHGVGVYQFKQAIVRISFGNLPFFECKITDSHLVYSDCLLLLLSRINFGRSETVWFIIWNYLFDLRCDNEYVWRREEWATTLCTRCMRAREREAEKSRVRAQHVSEIMFIQFHIYLIAEKGVERSKGRRRRKWTSHEDGKNLHSKWRIPISHTDNV